MGSAQRPRHARAPLSRRTARPTPASRRGWSSCSPTTTTRCWPRTSTTRRRVPYERLRGELAAQTGRGAGASGVLRLGDHRRGRGRADRRHHRAAARGRRRRRRPGLGHGLQGRARPAGREDRLRPDVLGHGATRATRLRLGAGRRAARSPRSACSTAARAVQRASVARRADREALGSRRRPDRRRDRRRRAAVGASHHFAPPTLETVVVPRDAADKGALHVALAQLAEQDPLINLRQDDVRQEIFVSLYGEVQKEVIQATLATTSASTSTSARRRRSASSGRSAPARRSRCIGDGAQPVPRHRRAARRAAPPIGSGVGFRLEVELGSMPLSFHRGGRGDRPRRRCSRASTAGRSPTARSP